MTYYNMVDEVVACYTMQGVVHNHFYPTPAVKTVTPEQHNSHYCQTLLACAILGVR